MVVRLGLSEGLVVMVELEVEEMVFVKAIKFTLCVGGGGDDGSVHVFF